MIAELVASAAFLHGSSDRGAAQARTRPVALVTAETQNTLLAISLRSGRVLRKAALPFDPENVEVDPAGGPAVVVSTSAGKVSLLDPRSLLVRATFSRFRQPHIAARSPDGHWVYVSDDGNGLLSVIDLRSRRIVARLFVGLDAHHMTVSPDGRRLWIALGERAQTLVVVDVSNPQRPELLGRVDPSLPVHDLAFGPGGKTVWLTSATSESLQVVDSRSGQPLFSVAAGRPPQHIVVEGRFAYITSGYDGLIELVDARSGRLVRSASVPRGSFNLAVSGDVVVTSSLLDGKVTELTRRLRLLVTYRVAPVARDVGLVHW